MNKTMSWTDLRGHKVRRDVALSIGDIESFRGTPGYALLVVAANTHLSVGDIERYLTMVGGLNVRSRSWIQRRRWLFQQPGTDNSKGRMPNGDGQAARAVKIMRTNPTLSIRDLVKMLREHGIKREREWVRQHRYDAG